jgi:hypothetical protein
MGTSLKNNFPKFSSLFLKYSDYIFKCKLSGSSCPKFLVNVTAFSLLTHASLALSVTVLVK